MRPFLGSEALASGTLTRGQLRWRYTAIFPDVYVPKDATLTSHKLGDYQLGDYELAEAAWLWSGRTGVVTGRTAARLHGAFRIPTVLPVDLVTSRRRPPPGVEVRAEQISDDEICDWTRFRLTNPARTALDIGRRLPRTDAVVILDALASSSNLTVAEVGTLTDRYPGTRGIDAARVAAALMDGGAQSPQETRLRLQLIDAGLPKPQTQITIGDEYSSTTIPMGWPAVKVGVEFVRIDACRDITLLRREAMHRDVLQFHGWHTVQVSVHEIPRVSTRRVYQAYKVRRRRGL